MSSFEFHLPLPPRDESLSQWMQTVIEQFSRDHPKCCALIDQNRYIGSDPVGHACMNLATELVFRDGFIYPVCGECGVLVGVEPERVTLPPWAASVGGENG